MVPCQRCLHHHLLDTPPLDVAHPQETLERLTEAGGEVSAVLAVFEVSVVGGLVVGREEAGDQDRAGHCSEARVPGGQSVEGVQPLHHSGQGAEVGLTAGVRAVMVTVLHIV